jgi:pimeloyl-ACP methyl ester carboxylesterase
VFLFDFEAIKLFSLCFELPTPEDYCSDIKQVLDLHNVAKVNIVGHSFGTITAAWFIEHCPDYVSHLTLIDPVSLLLAHPDVAYNFLYRPPSTVLEWIIYYGASQEITIANCLRRNFWWYNNVLWLEDVPSCVGVHVSLAGADQVSRTSTIVEYIETCAESRRRQLDDCSEVRAHSSVGTDGCNSARIADINYSVRAGHSHAQILASRHSLMELAFLLHQEYKKAAILR